MNNNINLKEIWNQYKGAIIGIIVGILILCTQLYKLIIGIILLVICAFVGNYIQHNKYDVKEKLKSWIDKM